MSNKRKPGLSFVLSFFLLTASVGAASANRGNSAHSPSTYQALSAVQESMVTGGDALCRYVEGIGVGLGIAGLLGCLPCAAPAAIIALGALVAC